MKCPKISDGGLQFIVNRTIKSIKSTKNKQMCINWRIWTTPECTTHFKWLELCHRIPVSSGRVPQCRRVQRCSSVAFAQLMFQLMSQTDGRVWCTLWNSEMFLVLAVWRIFNRFYFSQKQFWQCYLYQRWISYIPMMIWCKLYANCLVNSELNMDTLLYHI